MPRLIKTIEEWLHNLDGETRNRFFLRINDPDFVELSDEHKMFPDKILLPKMLDSRLQVGWQHITYSLGKDPKKEITDTLMDLLLDFTPLRECLVQLSSEVSSDTGKSLPEDRKIEEATSSDALGGGCHDWQRILGASDLDSPYL